MCIRDRVDSDQVFDDSVPFEPVVLVNELLRLSSHDCARLVTDLERVLNLGSGGKVVTAATAGENRLAYNAVPRLEIYGTIGGDAMQVYLVEKDANIVYLIGAAGEH